MQDPRTGQELGTGPKVRRMFPIDNLRLPLVAHVSVAAAAAISSVPSLALWHARLGHASSSQVQELASKGLLGSVSTENFDYVSYQLGKQSALRLILVNQYPLMSLTLFILMFGGLPLSLVLVGLDILLSLMMITFAIAGFLI